MQNLVEEIAKVCHEANRAYCLALGDDSHLPWEDAPGWQRDSAIKGVRYILENDNASPADSHASWMLEKARDGWSYGEVKDEVKKTHPCFVEYDKLPVEQRAKDHIFGAIVRTLRAIHAEGLGDGMAGDRKPD